MKNNGLFANFEQEWLYLKRCLLCLLFIGLATGIGGCRLIYKPDIKQGNILNPDKIELIKPGMSKAQVTDLLGTPVLTNVFNDKEMIYVYSIQPGHGKFTVDRLRVYFKQGRVSHYVTDISTESKPTKT